MAEELVPAPEQVAEPEVGLKLYIEVVHLWATFFFIPDSLQQKGD
jgi:hypothetical protein